MIEFLAAQPEEYRDTVLDLLGREAVHMAILFHMDFATTPVFLSNRNVPFTDLKWGHTWSQGSGLLVGLPEISGGDGQLAPFREFRLGLPNEWIDAENWAADLVSMVGNVSEYRGRDAGLYGQLFDPDTGAPVGHPFAMDVGVMDRMTVSFPVGGAIVTLTTEGFMSRKGAPVYGMQTYNDQKRRYPTDEGMEFTVEAEKTVNWTDW